MKTIATVFVSVMLTMSFIPETAFAPVPPADDYHRTIRGQMMDLSEATGGPTADMDDWALRRMAEREAEYFAAR